MRMKRLNALLLSGALFLMPVVAAANLFDDDLPPAAIPEPSGAVLLGVALALVALATRRR
jgi:hypothetical protein